jgi:AcrR family transcriptional regulator
MNSSQDREDLRVQRTHKLLWEALMSLMTEQDFEKISVKDICDRAMVHRTTFYKHYEDKYDLLLRGMRAMHAELKKTHRPEDTATFNDASLLFVRMFEHVAEHKRFYKLMLCGDGIGTFYMFMKNYLVEIADKRLRSLEDAGKCFQAPLPVIAQLWAGAIISAISWWLENDLPYTPVQMAQYMCTIMIDKPDASFNLCFDGALHRQA